MKLLLIIFLGLSSCLDREDVALIPYKKSVPSLPLTFDPASMNDTSSLLVSEMIYDGLLRFDGAKVLPAIAKDWKVSNDNLSITFFLKDGAKFHNDQSITADDVITSLARYLSPESKVYNHFDSILGAEDYRSQKSKEVRGIIKVDSTTIQIKLKNTDPKILMSLAGATAKIFPANHLRKKDFFKNPIGSGAYKIKDIKDKTIILSRFANYHSIKPKHEEFHLIEHDSIEKIQKSLAKKEVIDYSGQVLTGKESFDSRFTKKTMTSPETWIIGLNSSIPPFNSKKFRKVFKNLFDSKDFREKFHKTSIEAKSYIPPHLLETDINMSPNKNLSIPEHQTFDLYIPQELAESKKIEVYLQTILSTLGFKVRVKAIKWHDLMKHYDQRSASALLYSMNIDYPDAYFMFQSFLIGDKDNFFQAKNEKLHQLILDSKNTRDHGNKVLKHKKIAQIIEDEAYTVNLLHPRHTYFVHKCIKNFKTPFMGIVHADFKSPYIKRGCHENS